MATEIHPTAVVDPGAELGVDVIVEAYAQIGDGVEIGDRTRVGGAAQVLGPTKLGSENRIFPQAAIGFEPQDLKFGGEEVRLEIGDRNTLREFCTVHRGTGSGGGLTTVGSDNLFMVFTHVGHDCHVGDRTILTNNATLAGHVEVHDDATVGAFSAVHQFTRVGRHAYIGGYTVLTLDALPFTKVVGQKPVFLGVNSVGMKRKGMSEATIKSLEAAYRVLIRSKASFKDRLEQLRQEPAGTAELAEIVAFVEASERGVVRSLPGRRSGRGGS